MISIPINQKRDNHNGVNQHDGKAPYMLLFVYICRAIATVVIYTVVINYSQYLKLPRISLLRGSRDTAKKGRAIFSYALLKLSSYFP